MKRTLFKVVPALLVLGLILAGCAVPNSPVGAPGARAVAPVGTLDGKTIVLNYDWVMPYGGVKLYTEFKNGTVWNGYREGLGSDNKVENLNVRVSNPGDESNYVEYASFCGHMGSGNYADSGYAPYAFDEGIQSKIASALNYIYDTYGSLDSWAEGSLYNPKAVLDVEDATRVLAQMAVWSIIAPAGDDFEVASMYVLDTDRYANINAALAAVLAAANNGYRGDGLIGIYYMADLNDPTNIRYKQPQIIPFLKDKVTPPNAKVTIEKTVGGVNIATWASTTGKNTASLISFDLVDANGKVVASATPDAKGMVTFAGIPNGTYTVVENLSAAGKLVFEQVDPMTVTITNGKQDNGTDFDPNAKYMGLSGDNGIGNLTKTDNDGTNPYTIYNFTVKNEATGSTYLSFCGNYGSGGLGEIQSNLWNLDPATQADITSMLNYIFAKYGSIDKWSVVYDPATSLNSAVDDPAQNTKLIAQIAIWMALGEGLQSINLPNCPNLTAAIQDVVTNGKTTLGNISVFFLAGVDYPTDIQGIQPQIVPIYGAVFNNTELPPPPPPPPVQTLGPAQSSVTATNAGNIPLIKAGLNPKNGNPVYNDKTYGTTPFVVPNSNHFVYAELDRAALVNGVDLQFVVGNDYQIVGTGSVKLSADGKSLVITINGKGSFGALAFTSVPSPKNGNIQSVTKAADAAAWGASAGFSFNSQYSIPCPAGNGPVYLYIDCDSFQFYK